jgi:hypothetical protein
METFTTSNLGQELLDLQRRHKRWSEFTFGPGRKPWNHLKLEAQELAERPRDITEMADVLLLLMDTARMAGFDIVKLCQAANEKQAINETREWGRPDENGVCRHVKTPREPLVPPGMKPTGPGPHPESGHQ